MLRSDVEGSLMPSWLLVCPGRERSRDQGARLRSGSASVGAVALWIGTLAPLAQPSVSILLLSTRGRVPLQGHLLLEPLEAALLVETLLVEAPLNGFTPLWSQCENGLVRHYLEQLT